MYKRTPRLKIGNWRLAPDPTAIMKKREPNLTDPGLREVGSEPEPEPEPDQVPSAPQAGYPSPDGRPVDLRFPTKVVSLYVVFAVFWIFLSEELLAAFIRDPETALWLSIANGWLFILVTTTLLYLLIRRFFREISSRDRTILAANASLEQRVLERTTALEAEIAERSLVEERLRRSEERLRLTLDGAELGIWHHQLDPEQLDWSDICSRHLALQPGQEPSYAGFIAALHPDDRARVMQLVEESLASRQDYAAEYRVLWPDGSLHWISALGRVYCGSDGTPERLGGITLDITERKHLEEQLKAFNASLEQRIAERTADLVATQERLQQALTRMAQSEQEFRTLFEESPAGIAVLDARTGQILDVNARLERILQRNQDEIEELGWAALTHPDDLTAEREQVIRLKAGEINGFQIIKRYLSPDGSIVWGNLTVTAVETKAEGRQLHLAVVEDITERQSAEQRLRESEERYRMLFNNTMDAILIVDLTGRILDINDPAIRQYGYTRDVMLQMHITEIDTPQDSVNVPARLALVNSQGQAKFEAQHRNAQGRIFPVEVRATKVLLDGQTAFFGLCRDVSAEKKAQERIEYLAFHDELTGLPNRVQGQYQLQQALTRASRHHEQMALLYLDLDQFKHVNDTYGHAVGDQLLKDLAERLRAQLQAGDILCRLSADEFMLVLPVDVDGGDPVTSVARICERLLASIAVPFDIQGYQIHVSSSIGVAIYPADGTDGETLMRNSDQALFAAKRAGRQTYYLFEPRLNDELHHFIQTRDALRAALERQELIVHYQPQLDLSTGRVVGVEALVRWRRPGVGLVMPSGFIAVAEESGLIVPLGRWVLAEACRQAAAWRQAGWPDLVVAVNLSAVQFRQQQVVEDVRAALAESGLAPNGLDLELTESLLYREESVPATLLDWKDRGIQISIDDFGTGYSSLAYLKRFKVDKIKIDRSFVVSLVSNAEDRAIVEAIIQIAHGLNIRILAEGIERTEQAKQLSAMGCDEVQGYLYAPPLSAAELTRWLEDRSGLGHDAQPDQAPARQRPTPLRSATRPGFQTRSGGDNP
jgi:diguanylate cyclase (GGDEF)-like protein/PAS domain S-box-containing protein